MLSAFLNPWTFLAGAALVSTPIIIHLINRIRFRRVKWAAMEFLLKAQKKMRRKKILEQLLLLFLRCLLVFLAGVLFARFIGCESGKGKESRPTTHLVILDDTPSMGDAWTGENGETTSFKEAKRLIHQRIMPAASEAIPTSEGQRELCRGQGAELVWGRHPRPLTSLEVLDIFRLKTAPAFAVALRVGAIYAGLEAYEEVAETCDLSVC